MSEEAQVEKIEAPAPPVKRKAGRPKKTKKAVPALGKKQTLVEKHTEGPESPHPVRNSGWYLGRAAKIKIHNNLEEGHECVFKLGDSPFLYVRRGVEVIVPWEVLSLLEDAVVDVPRWHSDPGNPAGTYTMEKFTRFEYSFFGEVPWEEYVKFRDEQKKKK